ncbi:MAG: ugpQ [Verrucomicrobiales bacterium]|nr:ugpQ [Verrucomicrobiales bacterium]
MKSLLRTSTILLAMAPALVSALEIIAHRGASADAPENTLEAMELAWEQKSDAAELDLWQSKDGRLIVFHDNDTKRFETEKRKIKDLTLEEVRKLDVGSFKDPKFAGTRVPSLESILAIIPDSKREVLEIKDGPEIIPELVRVLKKSGVPKEKYCVISFNEATLRASKKALPDIPHYFLMGYKKDAKTGEFPELEPLITLAKEAGFEGLNLHSDWPITPEFTAKVKAAGLKLMVWTVDDAALAQKLVDSGVDAITTNKPAWLREQLKK